MRITNVRIHQFEGEGKVKAFCTVVFDGVLTVTDLKVVAGSKGLFVSMPSRRNKDGQYKDIVYPCTAEMRQAIQEAVLGAYRALVRSDAEEISVSAPVAVPEVESGLEGEPALELDSGLDGMTGMEAEPELDAELELATAGGAYLQHG
ncbi:MAG: SpoVG family protein [Symbiobacterium sp.]|mgnify:CR=1 FL=1|uniref:SpoVG family protein n=1 Tax=Symbiobacterium sp. TaxID=1971213 RepID=UPI003463C519